MREVLGAHRRDRMDVLRGVRTAGGYGAVQSQMVRVYDGVPCRLSFSGLSSLSFSGTATPRDTDMMSDLRYRALVFHDPGVDVRVGDVLEIDQNGRRYRGVAGESIRYASHAQTPVAMHRR